MSMDALILVDIQNDFVPGGALAVPEGDQIVSLVNRLQQWFRPDCGHSGLAPGHARQFRHTIMPERQPGDIIDLNGVPQILWPDHCVQNTPGADFRADAGSNPVEQGFPKGHSSRDRQLQRLFR